MLCDKMEVCIKRSSYTSKKEEYLEEKYLSIEYTVKLSLFFMEFQFYLKKHHTENCSYSDLGIKQTFSWKLTKEDCHFKKNKWLHLLSMIIFDPWSENHKFGNLVFTTMSLIAFQNLKTANEICSDSNKCNFKILYNEMHQDSQI